MREQKLRLVVTFYTTAAAMACEKLCREHEIPGRLAPVPRKISSDCGIAWITQTQSKEKLKALLGHLQVDQMQEVLL